MAADALPMAYAVDVLQGGWWTGAWDATGLAVQVGCWWPPPRSPCGG